MKKFNLELIIIIKYIGIIIGGSVINNMNCNINSIHLNVNYYIKLLKIN